MSSFIINNNPDDDPSLVHSIPLHQHPNSNTRSIPYNHLNSYVYQDQQQPQTHQPMPHSASSSMPKVGQTRCYWTLLSSHLEFIYLDPVLAYHLQEQAESLCGKRLLDFVHPDEQASAKQDLGNVLEARTLHGSVTRVRFCRLSRVRRLLGHKGIGVDWEDAEKIALDTNYMAVDIVINWAAEGLVLCFIHAIVDLNPADDNDERLKTGWTNWCGTQEMTHEQLQLLFDRLSICVPQAGSLTRVFQILCNQADRSLLVSWPPDSGQEHSTTSVDFAKLVADVQIGNSAGPNDAKTSCTRRYKACQELRPGTGIQIESVFIPHGSVIFACHKVATERDNSQQANLQMSAQVGYNPGPYPHQQYYDSSYNPQGQYNYVASLPAHQQVASTTSYGSQSQWPPGVSNIRTGSYTSAPSHHTWPTSNGLPMAAYSVDSPGGSSIQPQASQPPPPQNYTHRPDSPGYMYGATSGSTNSASGPNPGVGEGLPPGSDVVPPPRRRVSPGSSKDGASPSTGKVGSNRPAGIPMCSSCKATTSPEWRKGPSGKKELCNACGLRYARSRAKKEVKGGSLPSRKRKEKGGITKRDSATPPTPLSATGSYTSMRRSLDDSSMSFLSSSSTASTSPSNESFSISSHTHHHSALSEASSSPSPSSVSVGSANIFINYSAQTSLGHHSEEGGGSGSRPTSGASNGLYSNHNSTHSHGHGHGHSHGHASSAQYHQPSPLSSHPPLIVPHPQHHHHHQQTQQLQHPAHHPHPHHHHLPPLHHHPASPTPQHAIMPPASFERGDREPDGDVKVNARRAALTSP